MGLLIAAILLVIVLVVLVRCIVIVPQSNSFVVERLGVYKATWEAGLHLKMPFIERVARRVSLKEEVADFPPQPVITRDNVTMMIDTVVFFQVFDAKAYAYGVSRPIQAIENLSADPITISKDDTVGDALALMKENKIGGIPVERMGRSGRKCKGTAKEPGGLQQDSGIRLV